MPVRLPARHARPRVGHIVTRRWSQLLVVLIVTTGCGEATQDLSSDAAQGEVLARQLGCAGCHGDAQNESSIGPGWVGSWGDTIELSDGRTVLFDGDYVTASVREPDRDRRPGDWLRMPAFSAAQLSDDELAAITAYLRELGS